MKTECTHCGGQIEFEEDSSGLDAPCPHCGQITRLTAGLHKVSPPLSPPEPPPAPAPPPPPSVPSAPVAPGTSPPHAPPLVWDLRAEVVVGYLIVCLGLIMGFYYYDVFDTSVPSERGRPTWIEGDRVVNTGLSNDRLVGAIAALGLIITGGTMVISGRVKAATRHLAYVRVK